MRLVHKKWIQLCFNLEERGQTDDTHKFRIMEKITRKANTAVQVRQTLITDRQVDLAVKPESYSPIPCLNILTLRSDQV